MYNRDEIAHPPAPADYSFATFVRIDLPEPADGHLVGLIYDTTLMNPDFGNLGPRLSPPADLEIFSPDYLMEKAFLLGIVAIGWVDREGATHQGVPLLAGVVDAMVEPMADEDVAVFHCDVDVFCIRYAPLLIKHNNILATDLLLAVIERLQTQFPEECERLDVLRKNLAWRSIVQPAE